MNVSFVMHQTLLLVAYLAVGVVAVYSESRKIVKIPDYPNDPALQELVQNLELEYESYDVTTEDGYIINLNRLVLPEMVGKQDRGVPILLINGLLLQSEAWIVNRFLDSNIGRSLANRGYDVWLGDQRGTLRSMRHVNLTHHQKEFWDFSFHESGVYDLPAFVDFILKSTGHKRLIFGCMSLGCTYHFVLLSSKPEYNEKFIGSIGLGPVGGLLKYTEYPLPTFIMMRFMDFFVSSYENNNVSYIRNGYGLKTTLSTFCNYFQSFFDFGLQIFLGRFKNIDPPKLCHRISLAFGGGSLKTGAHVLQILETGDFAEFSYGRKENMKRYGRELPPLYDLRKVTSFVALYSGTADIFVPPRVVDQIQNELGGPTYRCVIDDFHHLDFGVGRNLKKVLLDIIKLIDSLSGYANDSSKMLSGSCPEYIQRIG